MDGAYRNPLWKEILDIGIRIPLKKYLDENSTSLLREKTYAAIGEKHFKSSGQIWEGRYVFNNANNRVELIEGLWRAPSGYGPHVFPFLSFPFLSLPPFFGRLRNAAVLKDKKKGKIEKRKEKNPRAFFKL